MGDVAGLDAVRRMEMEHLVASAGIAEACIHTSAVRVALVGRTDFYVDHDRKAKLLTPANLIVEYDSSSTDMADPFAPRPC